MATGVHGGDDPAEEGFELLTPEDLLPASRLPESDRRLGIDQWTGEAGLIAFAASLDRRDPWHVAAAWVMLAVLALPTLLLTSLMFRV